MNKKEVESVEKRIEHLKGEKKRLLTVIRESQNQITSSQILIKSLDGGIIELSSMLIDLNPDPKE